MGPSRFITVLIPFQYAINNKSPFDTPGTRVQRVTFTARLRYRLSRPRRMEPDTLVFLQTWADIVALACERWQQLKPRRNFLRIAVRRGVGARDLPTSAATSYSPFCYCYRALGAGASRGDIYSRHRGVMPAVSRGETL